VDARVSCYERSDRPAAHRDPLLYSLRYSETTLLDTGSGGRPKTSLSTVTSPGTVECAFTAGRRASQTLPLSEAKATFAASASLIRRLTFVLFCPPTAPFAAPATSTTRTFSIRRRTTGKACIPLVTVPTGV